jgi:hypothetical protein
MLKAIENVPDFMDITSRPYSAMQNLKLRYSTRTVAHTGDNTPNRKTKAVADLQGGKLKKKKIVKGSGRKVKMVGDDGDDEEDDNEEVSEEGGTEKLCLRYLSNKGCSNEKCSFSHTRTMRHMKDDEKLAIMKRWKALCDTQNGAHLKNLIFISAREHARLSALA